MHRLRLRITKAVTSRATKSTTLRVLASALPAPVASTLGLSSIRSASSSSKSASLEQHDKPHGPLAFLPQHTCPVCYSAANAPPTSLPSASFADPTLPSASLLSSSAAGAAGDGDTSVKVPYVADCRFGCRYCYYCVVGALAKAEEEAEDAWTCLRCGEEVRGAKREAVEVVREDDADEGEGEGDNAGTADEAEQDEEDEVPVV